jgi:hypothetical protein
VKNTIDAPVRMPENPCGAKGCQFAGVDGVRRADHRKSDGGDLDQHHGGVGAGALAHAAHQHPRHQPA